MLFRSAISFSRGSTRVFHPWDFPGKNTGVGCHYLLQGIFPNQGLNPGPLCWEHRVLATWCVRAQLLQTLCDPMDCGPPDSSVHGILQARILEWVAMPSSRESSQPRDRTHDISCVFCIAGRFFTAEPPGKLLSY